MIMAKCDQGYLCEVCGEEVKDITQSDLYLRFILGEIEARQLMNAPERHLACNPTQSQFIVSEEFAPIMAEGPFAKANLDPTYVAEQEQLVTRAWQRLQEVRKLGIPISEYPLPERLNQKDLEHGDPEKRIDQ